MRREWIEMIFTLRSVRRKTRSPSMRREWIEIAELYAFGHFRFVSLHAEGVD